MSVNNNKKSKHNERLEKQKLARRMRYAEIKNDPVLYKIEKEKEKERYQRRKEQKQIKSVNDVAPSVQKDKRKKWREAAKKYRQKKKTVINNPENIIKSQIIYETDTNSDDDLTILPQCLDEVNLTRKEDETNHTEESPQENLIIISDTPQTPETLTHDEIISSKLQLPIVLGEFIVTSDEISNRPVNSNTLHKETVVSNIPKCLETEVDDKIKRIKSVEYKKRQKLLLSIGKLQYENMQLRKKNNQQKRQLQEFIKQRKAFDGSIKRVMKKESNDKKTESSKPRGGIDQELEKIILDFVMEERRKYYSRKDFLMLDNIDPWRDYVKKYMKNNLDDINEFKKITINNKLNKELTTKVSIFKGDITRLEVDALVNSTNVALEGPTGFSVDAAIHRAAGPQLQDECDKLGGCQRGETKITSGCLLPAQHIIHTVGPSDGDPEILERCYKNCLSYHKTHAILSMAFPCIATGTYNFSSRLAAHIALRTIRKFLEENPSMDRIIFCVYEPTDKEIYEKLLQMYFPLQECS